MNSDINAIKRRGPTGRRVCDPLTEEIGKVIVGQRYLVERLLIGLFAQWPTSCSRRARVGQDLSVKTLAGSIDVQFSRIQFTPTCCRPT